MTHAYGDALAAANAEFDARVEKALSADQRARWEADGFSRVFGRQLPILPPSDWRTHVPFPWPSEEGVSPSSR
jgi:hypothetical protein